MKLDALDHPKTFDFAARLGVELPTAIGHLDLLWAFTGKQASQGNIGKWPNGAIARACYWMGDPDKFVAALIESGFLDTHDEHRLIVHDWDDHAPGWVRAKLKKLNLPFLSIGEQSLEPSLERSNEPSLEASTKISEVKLRVNKKIYKKSSQVRSSESELFDKAWLEYPRKGDTSKAAALKAWNARVKDGTAPEAMLAGVVRYAAYCRAMQVEQTYIKHPATFFGPNEHWSCAWEVAQKHADIKPSSYHGSIAAAGKAIFGDLNATSNQIIDGTATTITPG